MPTRRRPSTLPCTTLSSAACSWSTRSRSGSVASGFTVSLDARGTGSAVLVARPAFTAVATLVAPAILPLPTGPVARLLPPLGLHGFFAEEAGVFLLATVAGRAPWLFLMTAGWPAAHAGSDTITAIVVQIFVIGSRIEIRGRH